MSSKRIIAYFMHEAEEAQARSVMTEVEATQSYLLGSIDEEAIGGLQAQGLIVEEVATPQRRPFEGVDAFEDMLVSADPTAQRLYDVALMGPLLPDWRMQLAALEVTLSKTVGTQRYEAELSPVQVALVRNLPFVASCTLQSRPDGAGPLTEAPAPAPVEGVIAPVVTYDIRLRDAADAGAVIARLSGRDALVAGRQGRKMRVAMFGNSPLLAELRGMVEVRDIHEYIPPRLCNDHARLLLGIDAAAPGLPGFPYDGRGQIVGVADTGIDDSHPDLAGRIAAVVALGRQNDHSDPNGHGTHVAGSIAGDGTASKGAIRGMSPEAGLYFQSIMDATGGLDGLPWDLNDLFQPAYDAGVRIHNNSWSASTTSRYAFNSLEADEFVDRNRDIAIVIAAGNDGTAEAPFSTQAGFVDWLSIGSPATAKNAITVGASCSSRTSGGFATQTWGEIWPGKYPAAPIASERVSGDPASIAAFSGRGPCDDRRIKPDVVAPGTDIVSARSASAPLQNFWGSVAGHGGRYAFMGGTSMATPIVSGCLALVRQYYVDARGHEPSAALLKATLVNSTRQLTGQSALADHPVLPNFHQGFGCIHMPWAVPNPSEPDLVLEYLDTWKESALQLAVTGARLRFGIEVGDGYPLRMCLAYTDLPARALQNNLNIFVQSPADSSGKSTKWTGNQNLPMRLSPIDSDNNVEIVRIEQPVAGPYLIQIAAQNLLGSRPQDFALVVTGALRGKLALVP